MKIKDVIKTVTQKTWLSLLWGLSLSLSILMAGLFVLWSLLIWLGTPAGQKFVEGNAPKEISSGAYKMDLSGLSYSLSEPFALEQVKLYENEDVILDASDVRLGFDPKNFSKESLNLSLSVNILDKAVDINIQTAFAQNEFIIESIRVQAPDIIINGSGNYNISDKILDAKFTGTLESLRSYPDLVGSDHTIAPLSFNLALTQRQGEDISATFDIATNRYSNKVANIDLLDVDIKGSYEDDTITVTSLTARDQENGTLNASGTYEIASGAADISLSAREINLLRGEIIKGALDGDLTLSGNKTGGYILGGAVTAQKLDITIPESFSGKVPQLNIKVKGQDDPNIKVLSPADDIKLDVRIDAPRRVNVRGWGLDTEFGGSLSVRGTAADPLFYGSMEALRGRYVEFGKVFQFTNAKMNFSGSVPPNPTLDIEAQTRAGDIMAIINITGPVTEPKISFSSQPAMPEDEVLSYILFGNSMEDISPFQALQLAQTLARFSGQGGGAGSFDPVGALRNITGLDDLRIETNEQGGASVGAGKYLTDEVYLEFESGTGNDSGNANVQIELTPNITLESEIGQDSTGGAGIFWKRDY